MRIYRINGKTDKVKVLFIYKLGFLNYKFDISEFDLNEIPMCKVVTLYDNLEQSYNGKYRF